MDLITDIY